MQTHHYLLYLLVLAAYAPGLYAIARLPRLAAMPVITFTFLGMFLFTAVGSILVMTQPHFALGSLLSKEYVAMLVLQPGTFYLLAGPYVAWKRAPADRLPNTAAADRLLRDLLLLASVAILAAYYVKTGRFLLFDLLAGRINRLNILEYRAITYGLPEYPFFRLGFFVFPALAAALTMAMASAGGRPRVRSLAIVGACLLPPLLLAEKAALLHMGAVLFIAYACLLGTSGRPLSAGLNHKTLLLLLCAFVPTALTYLAHFSAETNSLRAIWEQFIFRIAGVYSETLAATVPFVEQHGYLGGTTMPNLKGLLPHERFNLEAAMHAFLASGTEYNPRSVLAGASPVPATGEGYVNFGWPGFFAFSVVSFGCVIAFQEVLLRLQKVAGALGFALSAWYGYLGFTLFTTSIFATFISLIHTVVAVGLVAAWWLLDQCWRQWQPADGSKR